MTRAIAALALLLAVSCSTSQQLPQTTAGPVSTPTATPAVTHAYRIVSRRNSKSVRIVPVGSSTGFDLDVGAATLGAESNGTVAALAAPDANAVVLVDRWPPRVRTVRGIPRPHEVAFMPGGRVAVTEENAAQLAVLDASNASVTKRIALPSRGHDVVADGQDRVVVTLPNAREIAVVDVGTASVRTIAVRERPHACAVVSSGIWCVTYDAPHVLLVARDRVVQRLTLGTYPHHLRAEADGRVLVSDPSAGRVTRLDRDGKVLDTFDVPGAEQVFDDAGTIFVASDDDRVVVISPDGRRTTWSIPGRPHAVTLIG